MMSAHDLTIMLILVFVMTICGKPTVQDKRYWYRQSWDELMAAVAEQRYPNNNIAKNIILFIGDGMDVTTTTAARILKGQRTEGLLGEEAMLSWDKFPYTGLIKTYSTDMMTVDSAASATAFMSGVKTKYQALGVDDNIQLGNCSTVENAKVTSLLDWSLAGGKSVGIVTTDSVVGATPAASYAHAAFRKWMADSNLPEDAKECKDIARQLIEDNIDIQVVLGGGRKYFIPKNQSDPEYEEQKGVRADGRNLLQEWSNTQREKGRQSKLVYDKEAFDKVDVHKTDYLLGMFEPDRMQDESIRRENNSEPSIADMTEKALRIIRKNPKGFFLLVEGANIDIGHHKNRARKALEETLALDDAVRRAKQLTSDQDTLVVVTADHSHTFAFGGYSKRGESILGVTSNDGQFSTVDQLGNNYTVLSYGNGPGYTNAPRENLTQELFETDQMYVANVPLTDDTHGGSDVPVFSTGPKAHLFTGVHEQTFIAHSMAYSACIGQMRRLCHSRRGAA